MLLKGETTRTTILKAASELFKSKGYGGVTMSDLCAATGLSRGGLYRYFRSIDDVFISLLEADNDAWLDETEKAFEHDVPATDMLLYFIEQMREGIRQGEGKLSLAAHMYDLAKGGSFAAKRYASAVDMFRRLLEYGQQRGEFGAFDAKRLAERNTIFVDGLRIAAATMPLDDETVAKHLDSILNEVKEGVLK